MIDRIRRRFADNADCPQRGPPEDADTVPPLPDFRTGACHVDTENTPNTDNSLTNESNAPSNTTELDAVREIVRKAHPQAVAELIAGDSVAAILESVPAAEAAYQRIAGEISPASTNPPASSSSSSSNPPAAAPHVPSGTPPAAVGSFVDVAALPAFEKIRRGVEAHKNR